MTKNILLKMYWTMVLIRRFEEKIASILRSPEKDIKTPCHLYIGQEAVAVGVCAALKKTDYIFGTHRSHGCYLAKGGNLRQLAAEIYCRANGCSGGNGGSMHLIAPEIGLLGTSAIVGASIPLAVGAALACKIKRDHRVAVAFFGDGATNEGGFYESLNLASLYKLSVIFVCENNLYSTHLPIEKCLANTNISQIAKSFKMPAHRIDGNDAVKVYQTARVAVSRARRGQGPSFIECLTYRWLGHVGPNDDIDKGLRSQAELDSWREKCPINKLEKLLVGNKNFCSLHQQIDQAIETAFKIARQSPYPDIKELTKKVFKE